MVQVAHAAGHAADDEAGREAGDDAGPAAAHEAEAAPGAGGRVDEGAVLAALRGVIDPEIGLNIVDLGLIYDLGVRPDGRATIEMTLTTPGCPLHAAIHDAVRRALEPVPGVTGVELALVWLPPWTPELITPAGRRALGWPEED